MDRVDKYVLIVHGSADDQDKARNVLARAKTTVGSKNGAHQRRVGLQVDAALD